MSLVMASRSMKRKREPDEVDDELVSKFTKLDDGNELDLIKKKAQFMDYEEELDEDFSRSSESEMSKTRRVRKKSTKVREMEEFEEIERKQTTKKTVNSDVMKTQKGVLLNVPVHIPSNPKKVKLKSAEDQPTTPVSSHKDEPAKGSVIKFLLSSPSQPLLTTQSVAKCKPESGQPLQEMKSESMMKISKNLKSKDDKLASEVSLLSHGQPTGKKEGDRELKLRLMLGPNPSVTPVSKVSVPLSVDTTPRVEAGVLDSSPKDGSLKMKFILSPKDKSLVQTASATLLDSSLSGKSVDKTSSGKAAVSKVASSNATLSVSKMSVSSVTPVSKALSSSKVSIKQLKTPAFDRGLGESRSLLSSKPVLTSVIKESEVSKTPAAGRSPSAGKTGRSSGIGKVPSTGKTAHSGGKVPGVGKMPSVTTKAASESKSPGTSKALHSAGKSYTKKNVSASLDGKKKTKKNEPKKDSSTAAPRLLTMEAHQTSNSSGKLSSFTKPDTLGKVNSVTGLLKTALLSEHKSSSSLLPVPADLPDLSKYDFTDEPNLVIAEQIQKPSKSKKPLVSRPLGKKTKPTEHQVLPLSTTKANIEKKQVQDLIPAVADIVEGCSTSKSKAASKKKSSRKKNGTKEDPEKPKKRRAPTAYMLWCNANRNKVVAENSKLDFAQISRRLGEIWQSLSEKEKLTWKRKAKKAAGKGSTLISTGKGSSHSKSSTSSVLPAAAPSSSAATPASVAKLQISAAARSTKTSNEELALSPIKGFGLEPVDMAAHLKLLGESLSIIGKRLQEHKGMIAVQGSLSVLLDSMLCAFTPLLCLTNQVTELNGCSKSTHTKTLDNITYVMPGL